MPVAVVETAESGALHFGAQGGGQTLIFVLDGYTDPAVVWLAALAGTSPYLNGFIRNDIKTEPLGGRAWKVSVEYGTSGVGGGDQPLGGADNANGPTADPTGPSSDSTPLTSGFSFGIAFNSVTLFQSRRTISVTVADGATGTTVTNPYVFPVPAPGRWFHQAIGVGQDGKVEGCEVPGTAKATFKRKVARSVVTRAYFRTIRDLCGKTNNAAFYGQARGEVLYMGCDGDFDRDSGWSLTHNFACEQNQVNIPYADDIIVPAKKGWEYAWVAYREIVNASGLITTVPMQVSVEQVFEEGNFANIGIGT